MSLGLVQATGDEPCCRCTGHCAHEDEFCRHCVACLAATPPAAEMFCGICGVCLEAWRGGGCEAPGAQDRLHRFEHRPPPKDRPPE